MKQDQLSQLGFNVISAKPNYAPPDTQENGTKQPLSIAVVHASDHKNPQIVFKLPRTLLAQLQWDIADRVKIMRKPGSPEVALVKAFRNDPNTFAVSCQGASVQEAKAAKRAGVVRVGWRPELGHCPQVLGTHTTTSLAVDKALIVKLPKSLYATS